MTNPAENAVNAVYEQGTAHPLAAALREVLDNPPPFVPVEIELAAVAAAALAPVPVEDTDTPEVEAERHADRDEALAVLDRINYDPQRQTWTADQDSQDHIAELVAERKRLDHVVAIVRDELATMLGYEQGAIPPGTVEMLTKVGDLVAERDALSSLLRGMARRSGEWRGACRVAEQEYVKAISGQTRPHVGAHVAVKPHCGKPFLGTVVADDRVHLWVSPDSDPNVAGRYLPEQLSVIT